MNWRRRPPPLPPAQEDQVRQYVESFDGRLADRPITVEMPVLQQPQTVAIIPTERPCCVEHSGFVVRITHLELEAKALRGEVERLRSLPLKVVGAALAAGASIAVIVQGVVRFL